MSLLTLPAFDNFKTIIWGDDMPTQDQYSYTTTRSGQQLAYQQAYLDGVAQQQQQYQYQYVTSSPYATWSSAYNPEDLLKNPRYEKLNLKEYSKPEFSKIKNILPKDMVPHAVMCPKEDIKNRIMAYLND